MSEGETAGTVKDVATALSVLGSAYRGDWSNFDGRSLRSELDELAEALTSDTFDLRRWYLTAGICPDHRSWAEHCDQRSEGVGPYWCDHLNVLPQSGRAPDA